MFRLRMERGPDADLGEKGERGKGTAKALRCDDAWPVGGGKGVWPQARRLAGLVSAASVHLALLLC